MREQTVSIGGRTIGAGHPPYMIAELSGNHNGELTRAMALVDAAAGAGADAVKLQTYTPDTMTLDIDDPLFRIHGGPWDGRRLHELYAEAQTPWLWHPALFAHGRARGLQIFSSPFDESAVEFLDRFDPPAYKIASFEIVDHALIRRVAATGKPLILSTGMAEKAEILDATAAARDAGAREIVLLHCVSGYPSDPADANLATMADLAEATGSVVGLSDHTLGTAVAVAAVALGASVIEKHVTLSRADGGPDAGFSLEPRELRQLVADCRRAWSAVGRVTYDRAPSERANLLFRRSLFVVADVAAGEALTPETVRAIRPGHGLPPKYLPDILGRPAARALKRGTPLSWEMVGQTGPLTRPIAIDARRSRPG